MVKKSYLIFKGNQDVFTVQMLNSSIKKYINDKSRVQFIKLDVNRRPYLHCHLHWLRLLDLLLLNICCTDK